jgi:hypothetical protein
VKRQAILKDYCFLLVPVSVQQMAADPGNQDGKHIAHQIGNMPLYMLKEKNSQILKRQREQKRKGERLENKGSRHVIKKFLILKKIFHQYEFPNLVLVGDVLF